MGKSRSKTPDFEIFPFPWPKYFKVPDLPDMIFDLGYLGSI